MLEFGELLTGTDYLIAQRARHVLRMAVRDTFTKHRLDGLVAPSAMNTAVAMSGEVSADLFAQPIRQSLANIVGLPDYERSVRVRKCRTANRLRGIWSSI